MTKLLNKLLQAFALYSLIVLLISIPVYTLVVDYIWVNELDENNWLTLQHTKEKIASKEFTNEDLKKFNQIWIELQPGVSISPMEQSSITADSIYEVVHPNKFDLDDGEDRFRGLKSHVSINGDLYQISIETNIEEADETVFAISIVTFLFFVILIVGFIVLNRIISKSTWEPFNKTLHSLRSFDLSVDQELDLPSTTIKEFQELNASLQHLVKRNADAYQQQKSFIENASHELQTPIALLKSKLDLLLQEKGLSPEIARQLSSIETPLVRLSRINKNLLLLAKVENQQFNDKEQLDLGMHLAAALALFEDFIEDKELILSNEVQEGIQIVGHPFLLETLLHNLLSNAIRHSSKGGKLMIGFNERTLYISNTGESTLDRKLLFKRFSLVTNEKVSSGLGLAIIKEVSIKNNWQVQYHFDQERHTFSVTF